MRIAASTGSGRRAVGRLAAGLLLLGCAGTPAPEASDRADRSPEDAYPAVRAALEAYREAFEARDLARLERVWTPTPDQRGQVQRLFGSEGGPLRMHIDWVAFTHAPGLAIADFDQTLRRGTRPAARSALTAALVPAEGRGWRIAFLAERIDEPPPVATRAPRATPQASGGSLAALPWNGGSRRSVAHLEAEMARRDSGEWVIVRLEPTDDPGSAGALPSGPGADAIRSVLEEYARAFEDRDAARLATVWLMNPYERAQVEALLDWSTLVDVEIRGVRADIEGDRARVAFAQAFDVTERPRVASLARRAFVRALAAHDAQGAWDLERLEHP